MTAQIKRGGKRNGAGRPKRKPYVALRFNVDPRIAVCWRKLKSVFGLTNEQLLERLMIEHKA